MTPPDLPVDPERLRREFPELTDEEVAAYVSVTREVLADPGTRARRMRELLESARKASARAAGGEPHAPGDERLVQYSRALGKLQRRVTGKQRGER